MELGPADELCTLTDTIDSLGATHTRDFSRREDFFDLVTGLIANRAVEVISAHQCPRLMYLP